MNPIRFTVCAEGRSDAMLLPVVRWLLQQHAPNAPIVDQFAEWFKLPRRLHGLAGKIAASLELHPCELLVVHRDADREDRTVRVAEIEAAVNGLRSQSPVVPPHVCLVPVKMSEAWLLFDEPAIRQAAGNPNGRVPLSLPRLRDTESVADPKAVLNDALSKASELTGRRLKNFSASGLAVRVANYIDDFSPLRQLNAFQAFEAEVRSFTEAWSPSQADESE